MPLDIERTCSKLLVLITHKNLGGPIIINDFYVRALSYTDTTPMLSIDRNGRHIGRIYTKSFERTNVENFVRTVAILLTDPELCLSLFSRYGGCIRWNVDKQLVRNDQ